MRRNNWKTVSTLVTALVIVGCQDGMISSPASSSVAPVSMMLAPDGAPSLSLNGESPANTSVDFTVTSKGGTFMVGNHAVIFPNNAICDPATSSYGSGKWDDACKVTHDAVTVHAEVRTSLQGTSIEFSPALRFAPAKNTKDYVWIVMYNPNVRGAKDLSKFGIMYAPTAGAALVDESVDDATLRTYVDTWSGITTRRIKHFSTYTNSSGRSCDPSTETDCSASGNVTIGTP
ncbi:MAG: hypothetical protein ABIY52_07445 [Gemmatimonadaceae bacterium]